MRQARPMFVAALAILGFAIAADSKAPIQWNLEVYKVTTRVVNNQTVEDFTKTSNFRPGETAEYRLTGTNEGDKPLEEVSMDLPIQSNTAYLDRSAVWDEKVATLTATAPGVAGFARPPLQREVTKDGKKVIETVPANEYTRLRWTLTGAMAPKQVVTLKARVRVR